MIINSFNINEGDMPAAETTRKFTATGNVGAQFIIIALQNPSSSSDHTLYYDFTDGAFEAGHNDLNNNLIVTLPTNTYSDSITFPSGAGEFVIKLMAIGDTELQNQKTNVITKSMSKLANPTITFTPGSLTTTANTYATLPTTTSTGAVASGDIVSFDWAVTNSAVDAYSHGLRYGTAVTINDSYWYFQATDTVDGAVSSSTTVVVDDLTDIVVGMTINEVSSGSLSGTPRITAIDTASKTLTLDAAQTFADAITLYFRAYGTTYIKDATGLGLSFGTITITPTQLTTTVRADSAGGSSTTVTLDATNGIGGGNFIKYKGVGVNNTSSNLITSVTPDPDGSDNDGAMVVQLAQTLTAGTVLTFSSIHKVINFAGIINIQTYPSANRTINLDLDKIITPGVAS